MRLRVNELRVGERLRERSASHAEVHMRRALNMSGRPRASELRPSQRRERVPLRLTLNMSELRRASELSRSRRRERVHLPLEFT